MTFEFNDHHRLEGTHAYLSASKHSWLNYDDDRLREVYQNELMKIRGTQMHAFAQMANKLGLSMPQSHKTIYAFINDGLAYDMKSEVLLYYSPRCYGTADLIGFDEKKRILRIFDLKTGRIDVMDYGQLHIYAALFCLEYAKNPKQLTFDLRFYQNDEIRAEENTDPEEIQGIMDLIMHFDDILSGMEANARANRAIM